MEKSVLYLPVFAFDRVIVDGCCKGNPGPGGYACVYYFEEKKVCEEFVYLGPTTNNYAELAAVLAATKRSVGPCEIWTDSQYAEQIYNNWGLTWKAKGWKKANGKSPQNLELVKTLLELKSPGTKVSKRQRQDVREADQLCSVWIGQKKDHVKYFETLYETKTSEKELGELLNELKLEE